LARRGRLHTNVPPEQAHTDSLTPRRTGLCYPVAAAASERGWRPVALPLLPESRFCGCQKKFLIAGSHN